MSQAATRFDEALRGSIDDAGEVVRPATFRWVREGDWEKFRRHCLNAARKNLGGEKWRYDRPSDAKGANRAKYPIDGLTGVLIGHNFAVEEALAVPDECIVEVFG